MKAYFVLLKIFVLSALLLISNYGLAMKDAQDRHEFGQLYYVWLSDLFDKAAYITGYVVRSEWLPTEETLNVTTSDVGSSSIR